MESTAKLRHVRVSAQKVRLVANLVRGRDVPEAIEILTFTNKKSAPMIRKLVTFFPRSSGSSSASTGGGGASLAERAESWVLSVLISRFTCSLRLSTPYGGGGASSAAIGGNNHARNNKYGGSGEVRPEARTMYGRYGKSEARPYLRVKYGTVS